MNDDLLSAAATTTWPVYHPLLQNPANVWSQSLYRVLSDGVLHTHTHTHAHARTDNRVSTMYAHVHTRARARVAVSVVWWLMVKFRRKIQAFVCLKCFIFHFSSSQLYAWHTHAHTHTRTPEPVICTGDVIYIHCCNCNTDVRVSLVGSHPPPSSGRPSVHIRSYACMGARVHTHWERERERDLWCLCFWFRSTISAHPPCLLLCNYRMSQTLVTDVASLLGNEPQIVLQFDVGSYFFLSWSSPRLGYWTTEWNFLLDWNWFCLRCCDCASRRAGAMCVSCGCRVAAS